MHVNVPLKEAIKIPTIKDRFNNFFAGTPEPEDPPNHATSKPFQNTLWG